MVNDTDQPCCSRSCNEIEMLKELGITERIYEELNQNYHCILNGFKGDTNEAAISFTDVERLKYRLNILKKEVEREENEKVVVLKNLVSILCAYFTIAVERSYPDLEEISIPVLPPTSKKFGDYQCNVALVIAGKLKLKPVEVAQKLLSNFPKNTGVVESVNVAGPGFLNVSICPKFLASQIRNICLEGVIFQPLVAPKKVIVDFSSPNVAKEMHVGHLRSTIIGDSICRLLEHLGHNVLRLNHVGDWGTQFGMLIAHLQHSFPNYLNEGFQLPISDLQSFYKESKKRFDEDVEFKKEAYACVVQLQSKNPQIIKGWEMICEVSRREYSKIYALLGVNLTERGESFYQDHMVKLVEFLREGGFLVEDEGRFIMWPNESQTSKYPPLTIIKSDGGFTYDTSDLAALKQRVNEESADWIVYVTDSGQETHFYSVFDCAERVGILDRSRTRVDHAGFGVVLGDDKKKFKTRSGDTVKLADLLDEGIKRAGEKLREKGRDKELSSEEFSAAQTAVAYGCIKYADLSHNRNAEYVFSFDRMLDDKGNTAVYLLYAYTRIKSIARKAGVSGADLKNYVQKNEIVLEHEKELKLAKKLGMFPEVIDRVAEDLYLHPLCEILYDISVAFTEFYDVCYCIEIDSESNEKKVNMNRVALCEATASVLKKGFDILGIEPVSRM